MGYRKKRKDSLIEISVNGGKKILKGRIIASGLTKEEAMKMLFGSEGPEKDIAKGVDLEECVKRRGKELAKINELREKFERRIIMIELGKKGKDKITGFEGIITGRAQYLYGCDQYCLVPSVDKDGNIKKAEWFDEGRIEEIEAGIAAKEVRVERPGGPQRDVPE